VIPVASWQRKFSQDQECNQATSRKMVSHAWNFVSSRVDMSENWFPTRGSHQRPENVKVQLLCHTLQHFCLHFVTPVWQFDIFFFSPKLGLKKQKHCCKFAQCRQRQKIIVRNQLVYSICLKHIPSLVTKCWCLCQSHKEVIESNMQDTFWITLHIK
jgi:hypothetical protein